ncbi:MAG: hypothetical protein ACXV3A_04925 [Kineosporiaceae bacterium]
MTDPVDVSSPARETGAVVALPEGAAVFDADWTIVSINEPGARLLGRGRPQRRDPLRRAAGGARQGLTARPLAGHPPWTVFTPSGTGDRENISGPVPYGA